MPPRKTKKEESGDDDDDSDFQVISDEEEEKPKKKTKATPGKKAAPKKAKAEESDDDSFVVDSDEDEKPKKKKAAPKAAPAKKAAPKKAKAEVVELDDDEEEGGGGGSQAPKRKRAPTPKYPKVTELTKLEDGWYADPVDGHLLFKDFEAPKSAKIAGFDLDGTLVVTKSLGDFPRDPDDWRAFNANVAPKLSQYHEEGYRIVIFTNQGGIKSALTGKASSNFRTRVSRFLDWAKVPAVVLASTLHDKYRKGEGTGMWTYLCEKLSGGVQPDVAQSFFVGDNIDGGDEHFAQSVGLAFRSERDEFGPSVTPDTANFAELSATGGGEATGPNAPLINVFHQLLAQAQAAGGDKSMWKVRALKTVIDRIQELEKPITNTKASLKEVSDIKGVGKGTMATIKEFLETGTVAALTAVRPALPSDTAKTAAPASAPSKAAKEAEQFM